VITQAAAATHTSQPPGLLLIAWGLGASALGLLIVTNFRGFADKFARRAEASSGGLRRRPPWNTRRPPDLAQRTRQVRLTAIPFAIIGPIVTVVGIISVSHRGITGSGPGALPGPFRVLFIAFAVATVAWSWLSRRGLFRPIARRGGWRLALALVSSLGGLMFGIGIAMGQMTIALVAVIIGGLCSLILVIEDKPAGHGPSDVAD
jgi:hypothetical protein